MPARPQGPWFRKGRGWYVKIAGKQVSLGISDPNASSAAWDAYHRHMAAISLSDQRLANPTVQDILGAFLSYSKKHNKPATYFWYERYLKSFCRHVGSSMLVSSLKRHHVTAWLESCYAGRSVRQPLLAAKRAFTWAVGEEYLAASPIRGVPLPKQANRSGSLSVADAAKILSSVPRGGHLDLFRFLHATGARVQEARTIQAVHFHPKLLAIILPIADHKTGKVTGKPRVIPLPPPAVKIIKRLAKQFPKGALFRNSRGEPFTSNAISQLLRRIRNKHPELPRNLCGTHFRHTLATNMVRSGENLDIIRQVLGHSDFRMLAQHYLHAQNVDRLREAMSNQGSKAAR